MILISDMTHFAGGTPFSLHGTLATHQTVATGFKLYIGRTVTQKAGL